MTVPESIRILIQRLDLELDESEQAANRGLELLQSVISVFSKNAIMIRYYAYFNNVLFFVNLSRNKIETIKESLLSENLTTQLIQETGEDLSLMLGQLLETKIELNRILQILD
ncbi:restriction endonuclease subunit S [Chroococcus sp. FPU101]|uniref:restriction endonuclease subunit S n=1 Tax=Chroococcus sp. FPU101 TaxID=1974212 RepID=UPI001A8C682F|nr:restriction endonuclease subunit S [Chroococcus sp. FPU101]GFE67869.1 hypothetical protein CFPU101_04790 [Chroococcus sp. FPU101]